MLDERGLVNYVDRCSIATTDVVASFSRNRASISETDTTMCVTVSRPASTKLRRQTCQEFSSFPEERFRVTRLVDVLLLA